MTKVLILDSAATGDQSVSRKLVDQLVAGLSARAGGADIVRRDIGAEPIPHLTADTVFAIRSNEASTDAGREALALSDRLIAELRDADVLVIGAPMYNFGIPSTLKAWFDHVLRARITFRYTEKGPEGLVTGKKAIVVESRAGLYSEGPQAAMDSQEPHLRTLLAFMGIENVAFVRAERLAFGPEAAEASLAQATDELRALALVA
ncbi:MAG TPA: FMN-dependent NADH-azoreductase [Allosphingosinicella sp.]|nr:FMN-dependent NADH-azoreductase [Allosphingosinicella sp.]